MNPSAFVVVAFLRADDETEEKALIWHFSEFPPKPERLCDVGILLFLLNHKAALPPQSEHGGEDGELLHVGVDVVEPELVHRQEGSGPSYSSAAVHQDRAW